jgi:hypothetical protein
MVVDERTYRFSSRGSNGGRSIETRLQVHELMSSGVLCIEKLAVIGFTAENGYAHGDYLR